MKWEDILSALPTKEDILNALPSKDEWTQNVASTMGYQKSAPATDLAAAFSIFGAGLLLGAGLALLFAPKPGAELRTDIANKVGEMNEQFTSRVREEADNYGAADA